MLPPFVPPSARAASEKLPLITEFVIDRAERSFEPATSSFDLSDSSRAATSVASLPSIDEFVMAARPEAEEFVLKTSRSASGVYSADESAAGGAGELVAPLTASALEADVLFSEQSRPSGLEDAIVNEVAEPADRWAASAAPASTSAGAASVVEEPAPVPPAEEWVAKERDAFDWQSVASLAVPPAEEQRAAEEWSSTQWNRSGGSLEEHVAGLLAQLGRRVRSGELEIQGSRQMGAEAALVSVLAALLAESARKP